MMENFRFLALGYLNAWWENDSRFVRGLSPDQSKEARLLCLKEAATYYQIARNFPKIKEEERLGKALDALDAVTNTITQENVDLTVGNLAKEFQSTYGKGEKISAASKFLWIRCQTPVLIYDRRAYASLKALGEKMGVGYAGYRSAWLRQFDKHEGSIRLACDELICVKDFSPDNETKQDLKSTIASRSFHERVFDRFLWARRREERSSGEQI